ncbi:MerR family transcriptional regulator [Paenibacillus tritici]|uniref:MerR family transcriptional regulator n=1 Tax=Paenibacillus tritici TaxID=1873425 RepID=A0ABX2DLH1_9BACL|nr:MerR family transcriptional regulator [Paenibacillus tritici]NQX45476.1 MerR family transcriptional regulator [Paenibacillus tritici]QUL56326.1 MerR family transcriptional regulator [Paenibacillus tritici]
MTYTVKEVSGKMGITPYTLRFYEKEGVIAPVERNKNGERMYTDSDMDMIGTVQALRSTGLSLGEIKQYVELYHAGDSKLQERKSLLARQKSKVEDQIVLLMKTLEKINYKMALIDAQDHRFDKLP